MKNEYNNFILDKLNLIKPLISLNKSEKVSDVLLFKDYLSKISKIYKSLGLLFDINVIQTKEQHNVIPFIIPELSLEMEDINEFRMGKLNGFNIGLNKYRDYDYVFIYLLGVV